MFKHVCSVASLTVALFAGNALAQVPSLVNGDFETPDAFLATFGLARPNGWRLYNFSEYRTVGDALTPPAIAHSGTHSVRLPGGEGRPNGEFEGVHAEEPLDFTNPNSPNNWPQYTYDLLNGQPITVSCWFNIPANDPMVKSRFGLKVGLLNGTNPGVFFSREWLDVDPEATTPFPGCTFVTVNTPQGPKPGIHTDGQWLQMTRTLTQAEINPGSEPGWQPPTNPAKATLLALRFDIFPEGGTPAPIAYGTVWVDDLTFVQGTPCRADFNGTGGLTVQDIFDFLSAWFAGLPSADFNQVNGITVQDIFDFLSAWFAGC